MFAPSQRTLSELTRTLKATTAALKESGSSPKSWILASEVANKSIALLKRARSHGLKDSDHPRAGEYYDAVMAHMGLMGALDERGPDIMQELLKSGASKADLRTVQTFVLKNLPDVAEEVRRRTVADG